MNRQKKVWAMILAAAVLAAALGACGNKAPESMTQETAESKQETSNQTAESPEAAGDQAGQEEPAEQTADNAQDDAVQEETAQIEEAVMPLQAIEEIPEGTWQKVAEFPDWKGYVDDTLAMNGMYSFTFWHGQGTLYVRAGEETEGFRLLINGVRADTSGVEPGGTYAVDFSEAAVNGTNTVEISGIRPLAGDGTVTVYIPYPEVLQGDPAEEGISPESLQLISDIIQSDIDHGFTSAQLAIVKNGRLVYENAWGRINSYDQEGNPLEDSPSVTTDTLYDLASVSKMMSTNYALQKLVSEGKISLDDTIGEYLGERFVDDTIFIAYKNDGNPDMDTQRRWKSELTVGDLLRHQGGFPPAGGFCNPHFNVVLQKHDPGFENPLYVESSADEETKEATIGAICKTPLMYEPGTDTKYSDIDFIVLGLIVEQVSGQDLDTYLKENFCSPMELTRVTYNPLQHGFSAEDCAATELNGNTRDGFVDFPNIRTETIQGEVHDEIAYYNLAGVSGHAGLFANAGDLAKLATVMLTGGYGTEKFFSRNVMDYFAAPKSISWANWGLGWWRQGDEQRPWYYGTQAAPDTVGHQGWTGTIVMVDPERDLVVVYLTNKINSRITDIEASSNQFDGNWYTASTLGFVPQILSLGMDESETSLSAGEKEKAEHLASVVLDMASESIRLSEQKDVLGVYGHPLVKNTESKLALAESYAAKTGEEEYIQEAGELREIWEMKFGEAQPQEEETVSEETAESQ